MGNFFKKEDAWSQLPGCWKENDEQGLNPQSTNLRQIIPSDVVDQIKNNGELWFLNWEQSKKGIDDYLNGRITPKPRGRPP